MIEVKYKITDPLGIHARPAGLLVKTAAPFHSSVKLKTAAKEADAKRIMGVMSCGVKCGDEIIFIIEGEDEQEAADVIRSFLQETL